MAGKLRIFAVLGSVLVTALVFGASVAAAAPQLRFTDITVNRFEPTPAPHQIGGGTTATFPVLSSTPETRAGAHPDVAIKLDMCGPQPDANHGCPSADWSRPLRDLKLSLPPGMLGNPTNVPACQYLLWLLGGCSDDSIVGWSRADTLQENTVNPLPVPTFLYNVETLGFEAARLGTNVLQIATPHTPVGTEASVRTDGDFGIDALTRAIPPGYNDQQIKVKTLHIVLFGHAGPENRPFFVNPTECGDSQIGFHAEAYLGKLNNTGDPYLDFAQTQDSTTIADGHATISTTCGPGDSDNFTFADSNAPVGQDEQPSVEFEPTSSQAGAPTGYKVKVQFPNSEDWTRHQAHLKDADVTLPDGVALSAAAGKELEPCTPAQWGVEGSPENFPVGRLAVNNDPIDCPTGSEVGDVEIKTPPLASSLKGKAYFGKPSSLGRPTDAHPWKLLLSAQGSGLLVKLAGDVTVDEDGTVHTKFLESPQTPFTDFTLTLNGGSKSVLQNPRSCGIHKGSVELIGWNGGQVASEPEIDINQGCANPEPFTPSVSASADNEDAGASSPSHLAIDRPDGNQLLKGLSLELPAGLVGSLTSVPLCSGADAEAGNCSTDSKIGSLRVTVGTDASNLEVPGSLYLAKPTDPSDVATLSIVIPGKVGPIDLGDVVVTNHVRLRQSDGGLNAVLGVTRLRSRDGTTFEPLDKLPTRLGGIPLAVKRIAIDVDRPGFLTNPTGCDPRDLKGSFDGDLGAHADASTATVAHNCDRLPFAPHMQLIVPGGAQNTHKGRVGIANHTPLRAIVTQAAGQSSIRTAVVKLPAPIRPDTGVLNKPGVLCTTAQANIGACGPQSQVGTASVVTPLLPEPLSGPVYIVQDPGNVLPKLLVQLRGMAAIDLVAGNRIDGFRTVNTFDNLPDVPQSRFELNVQGGPNGILFNFDELCKTPSSADATFTGHSGKTYAEHPELEVEGCSNTVGQFSLAGGRLKVSKRGVVAVKVSCPSKARCEGRLTIKRRSKAKRSKASKRTPSVLGAKNFSIAAGKTSRVKVRLKKAARRSLRKRRTQKVTILGKSGVFTAKQNATLIGRRR